MIGENVLAASSNRTAVQRNRKASPLTTAWQRARERILSPVRERLLVRGRADARQWIADVVEATPDLVFAADKQGHLHYCNPAARRALGLNKNEDVSPIRLADIYSSYSRTRVLGEGIMTAILDGAWSGEAVLLTRAGADIPVSQVIVAPSRPSAAEGRDGYLTIFARDLGETKRREAALIESEQFYRRIVDSADVGIWVVDPNERTGFANPRLARLLGRSVDEIVGQPASTFVAPMEMERVRGEEYADCRNEPAPPRRTVRRKDGREIGVRVAASPLLDENAQCAGTLAFVIPADDSEHWTLPEPSHASERERQLLRMV